MRKAVTLRRCWLALVLLAALAARGSYAADQSLRLRQVDADLFPTVRMDVSVVDGLGAPIRGLDATAFQVQEDGHQVAGLVADSGAPFALAIVIDVGNSMANDHKLDQTRDAVAAVIDSLGATDPATVVSFASRVTSVQDYTLDKVALKSAVDSLSARGGSVLYDALYQTAPRQASKREVRRPILLVTDADDSGSAASLQSTVAASVDAHATIYVVGLGGAVNKSTLDQIAHDTGGSAVFVSDPTELKANLLSIADQLEHEYALSYTSRVSDTEQHALGIQVTVRGVISTAQGTFKAPSVARVARTNVAVATPQSLAATSVPVATRVPGPDAGGQTEAGLFAPAIYLLLGALLAVGITVPVLLFLRRRPATEPHTGSADPSVVAPVDPYETQLPNHAVASPPDRDPLETVITDTRAYFDSSFDDHPRERIILRDPDVVIGRNPSPSSIHPIKLDGDMKVSRNHVRIFRKSASYFIADLNSGNGTKLNGVTLVANTEQLLNNGDRIDLGKWTLTFHG